MIIEQADGANGYAARASYDRIILTASTPTIPATLSQQLAPDGILVGILQPRFAMLGGLLKAQKQGEELRGGILDTASFMELRPAQYQKRTIQIDFHAPLFASFPFDERLFPPLALRENHAFSFFLYYDCPGLYVFQKGEALFYYQEAYPQGYVVFQQQPSLQVELRGDVSIACSLWNRLVRAYSFWDRVGQPAITHYAFSVNSGGQRLSLHTSLGIVWPFETA
ncbi:MAG: protein-L-isoaspartate O-methyltransferase family protein [Ktedonobacteraceae bacterium]